MAHSYSSIKMFRQCARQYHAVRVEKKYPYVQSEAAARGDRIHKALELYARDGVPLPEEAAPFAWAVDSVLAPVRLRGVTTFEHEFSLGRDKTQIDRWDWTNKFWTGKADVLNVDGPVAFVVDYKTGSDKYADTDQLELMAYFTFIEYPEVQTVAGILLFLEQGTSLTALHHRKDMDSIEDKWLSRVRDIEFAHDSNVWPETKSGLCGFCPVVECMHNRGKK